MSELNYDMLEQVIAGTSEPLAVIRADHPEWPVVLVNAAFDSVTGRNYLQCPFADVMEELADRELALEVSEAIRARQETSFPVELGGREYLLVLKPLQSGAEDAPECYAAYWRSGGSAASGDEMHHALLNAKRRIRDLSRDDPATGLLNDRAFRDVFEHDWAVAAREESSLAVVVFALDEFEAYQDVFGRHATDSALRRVGQAIRRCLRRASDVAARYNGHRFLVLSHAADEDNVREFAARISTAVRELGLHHPRSSKSRFVTMSYEVAGAQPFSDGREPGEFLDELLETPAD
ncbi:MAG: GGDEF domain-containing protein [Woeseiaceae bacterium]|nr:GGDEF domain-containing protein [Woeseiaceae bacterium]